MQVCVFNPVEVLSLCCAIATQQNAHGDSRRYALAQLFGCGFLQCCSVLLLVIVKLF